MKVDILRIGSQINGAFGLLTINEQPFCLTLERPWLNNEPMASCIPEGLYDCKRVNSPKFGNTFEVMDVPNRDNILFHCGNDVTDTHGCILLGNGFSRMFKGIENSRSAFEFFMREAKDVDKFTLFIQNA